MSDNNNNINSSTASTFVVNSALNISDNNVNSLTDFQGMSVPASTSGVNSALNISDNNVNSLTDSLGNTVPASTSGVSSAFSKFHNNITRPAHYGIDVCVQQ